MDSEKIFHKIQHTFMIKKIQQIKKLRLMTNFYKKSTATIILSGERFEAFTPRPRSRQGCAPVLVFFNTVLQVLANVIRPENLCRLGRKK